MRASESKAEKGFDALEQEVRRAHVAVATEIRDQPIENFSCRELPLGRLYLYDISIDPIVIRRRFRDIRRDTNSDFLLSTQIAGTVLVKQGDAEFTQRPGDLALMSAGEPYSVVHMQQSRRLVLHIPNELYQKRILGTREQIKFKARLFPKGGLVSVVHSMLESLAFEGDNLNRHEQYTLAESLLDLTAATVRAEADQQFESQHAKQSALFRRTLEYLEAHFEDPELTPQTVAKANGISMRYLHSLFHHSGTSVSRWLWERRLKAAREDLLNPNLDHRRISEIAFRRGFNDPAHFSRTFRSRFDISPSELRRTAARTREDTGSA